MTKKTMTPATALIGAALVGSLGTFGLARAADNPFAAQPLDAGYMQLAGADTEGKCGEGKCGADKGKDGASGSTT
ncbi:low-complexity protein [Thiocapsa sp.]|uniref:HvfA family oxazolone/thioamide-modified RiPP metallophore n=1 Tax=Thiocapsa sp. TaxID=2024551 RepID=UPI0035932197